MAGYLDSFKYNVNFEVFGLNFSVLSIYTFFLHDLLISLCMQLIYIRRLGQLICSETLLFNLLDIGYNTEGDGKITVICKL